MSRVLAAVLAALSGACAVHEPRALPAAPPHLARFLDAVDPARAGDEAARLLVQYLQVDTTNPPGNEAAGARFLQQALAQEGIDSELVELSAERASLVARLPGRGAGPPLCLLSHIDVVPAAAASWSPQTPPFAGVLRDGFVYGRGALDMKGTAVAQLLAFVALKRAAVPLARDVVLLAVADEEVGNAGVRQLLDERWERIGCASALTEGGIGLQDLFFPGQTVVAVSAAEKGTTWLELRARGIAGHGSTPLPGTALETMLTALERLRAREPEPVVHPMYDELLAAVGAEQGGLSDFIMRRPSLARFFVLDDLMEHPVGRAALTSTLNVTGLDSGEHAPNVVPGEIRALLDCRLLPGTDARAFVAELQGLLAGLDVSLEVLRSSDAGESPLDDPLYTALLRHGADGRPRTVVVPSIFVATSDASFLRARGVRVYGLMPFVVSLDDARTMHGDDERVSVENLGRAVRVFFRVLVEVAGEGGA